MARILIFSDTHLRHAKVDEVLAREEPFDQCVLLGDHFDGRELDSPEANRAAAVWIKERLTDPRFVFLAGNHDLPYRWWGNEYIVCGNSLRDTRDVIREVLTEADWARFLPCFALPQFNLLFSHAGLSDSLLPYLDETTLPTTLTAASIEDWVLSQWPLVCEAMSKYRSHQLVGAGADRRGFQSVGGLTWCDFDNHLPIKGLGQCFGHTKQNPNDGPLLRFAQGKGLKAPMWRRAFKDGKVRKAWLRGGWSLCLDTSTYHYAVIDTEAATLTIKHVKEGPKPTVIQLVEFDSTNPAAT